MIFPAFLDTDTDAETIRIKRGERPATAAML